MTHCLCDGMKKGQRPAILGGSTGPILIGKSRGRHPVSHDTRLLRLQLFSAIQSVSDLFQPQFLRDIPDAVVDVVGAEGVLLDVRRGG